jgi:large subunit ribosomal protein L21
MFAVIKTGGKQYKVAQGDKLVVEKLTGETGSSVTFDQVLMVGGDDGITVGAPMVEGMTVTGTVVDTRKGGKVMVVKKIRRNTYRRRNGHRQWETLVEITGIGGVSAAPKAAAKVAAPKEAAAAAETAGVALLPSGLPDDIDLIDGIGPVLEKKLRAAGINTLSQIAAWTDADVAKFAEELKLGTKIAKGEWIQQAKELVAGGTPRAKSDAARAASQD